MHLMADPLMLDRGELEMLNNSNYKPSKHEATLKEIDLLDMSMVKMKLCLPVEKEGKSWTTERADDCERFYKMFLKLHVICSPGTRIVPTKEIDEMWHAHILDTRKYHQDCERIFGWYLHHFPYFGLRSKEDADSLQRSFSNTCALFMEYFGEDPSRHVQKAQGQCCGVDHGANKASCGSRCNQCGSGTSCY